MNTIIDQDWKKYAAATTSANEDVEKAFLDQAYMFVQNKATPLMKSPYRVGFEIVHKNDENTRLVGVFVFRVNADYLFVPTFFINGNIKGTDLLYRARVKRFVPLDNDWCTYLLSLSTSDEGKGVSRRERQQVRDQLNLLDLVRPPAIYRTTHYKYASCCDNAEESAQVEGMVNEMIKKVAVVTQEINQGKEASILKRFITEHGGFSAMKKLANSAKHDMEFAQALMLGSQPENYAPPLEAQAKQASVPENLVVVHTSVLRNKNVKQASAADMCKGYKIEDFRKEAQVNEAVFADNCSEVNSVQTPGVYMVLMVDGTSRRMLIANYRDTSGNCCQSMEGPATFYPSGYDPVCSMWSRQGCVVVDPESKASDKVNPRDGKWIFGEYAGELKDAPELIDFTEAQEGEGYRIYDGKAEAFSDPFYVIKKEKDAATGLLQITKASWSTDSPSSPELLYNPDYRDYDPADNVFGPRCKLVKVHFDKRDNKYIDWDRCLNLGNKHSLNAFIFEHGFKKASVHKQDNGTYLVRTERSGRKWTTELSKAAATVKLMLDCAVRETTAEDMLAATEKAKEVDFFYDAGKVAHNVRFHDWPQFYDRMNSEFNVLEQPQTNYLMRTESDKPIIERHRIGDRWSQDQGGGDEAIDTMTPLQLYAFSKEKGQSNMFELGVVGELIKTYDAAGFIQNYIPDLETAVDRLGRIIFLFYWKPEDFSQAYGSDDQSSLENKFLSNFKALGTLTLELMQKSKSTQEGTVSLN